jgi:hypothetical protein
VRRGPECLEGHRQIVRISVASSSSDGIATVSVGAQPMNDSRQALEPRRRLELEAQLFHHAQRGHVLGVGSCEDTREPQALECDPKASLPRFGGEPTSPNGSTVSIAEVDVSVGLPPQSASAEKLARP